MFNLGYYDTIDVKESENFSTRKLKSDGGDQSIFNFQEEDLVGIIRSVTSAQP
jgi:hypothetical protein